MAKPGAHGSIDWDAVYTAHGQNFLNNEPTDNYFTGNPILDYLKADTSGAQVNGLYLVEPVIHTKQAQVQSVGRLEQASLATTDPVTAAEYQFTEYVCYVTIPGLDEQRASGMDARLNLVEMYIANAKKSCEEKLSQHLLATSQAATTDINPLPLAASTDGLGTVGNINSSTYSFWRSKAYATITASTGLLDKMRSLTNDVSAGNQGKRPGMWATTQAVWEAYVDLAEQAHVTQSPPTKSLARVADLGIQHASYQGIPVVWDPNCPSGRMYAINKEGIKLRIKGWDLSPFSSLVTAGIDGRVARLRCFVQLTVSQRRLLGCLSSIT